MIKNDVQTEGGSGAARSGGAFREGNAKIQLNGDSFSKTKGQGHEAHSYLTCRKTPCLTKPHLVKLNMASPPRNSYLRSIQSHKITEGVINVKKLNINPNHFASVSSELLLMVKPENPTITTSEEITWVSALVTS